MHKIVINDFSVNEKQRNMGFTGAEIFAHGVLTAVS